MFGAVIHKLVYLEQKICLTSEKFSRNIFIFAPVQDTAVAHSSVDSFDKILKALIYEGLLLALEFEWPFTFRKVIFEVLFNFGFHKLLSLENSLINRVEESNEHERV